MDKQENTGSKANEINLDHLCDYAQGMLTIEELADVLGTSKKNLLKMLSDKQGQEFKAFRKGRLMAKAAVNKSIIDCAKNGSHPAHNMAISMINKILSKDNNELDG